MSRINTFGGGEEPEKKMCVYRYTAGRDREECMCCGTQKSRRWASGGVPEMSSEIATDVRF